MDKGNTALLDAINGALEELNDDGTIQAILDKYIPANKSCRPKRKGRPWAALFGG